MEIEQHSILQITFNFGLNPKCISFVCGSLTLFLTPYGQTHMSRPNLYQYSILQSKSALPTQLYSLNPNKTYEHPWTHNSSIYIYIPTTLTFILHMKYRICF